MFQISLNIKFDAVNLHELIQNRYKISSVIAEKLLRLLKGKFILDLLFYNPRYFIDRYNFKNKITTFSKEIVTIIAKVENYTVRKSKNLNFTDVTCYYDNKSISILFFNRELSIIRRILKRNHLYIISGKLNKGSIVNPERVLPIEEFSKLIPLEPKYALTSGITNNFLCNLLQDAIKNLPNFKEWINQDIIFKQKWPIWICAIKNYHFPSSMEFYEKSRKRLAYDEALALYLNMHNLRSKVYHDKKAPINGDKTLCNLLIKKSSFILTKDQKNAAEEIHKLQNDTKPAQILLQGDVGSGKTIVAFLAMLNVVECQRQAVLLAPTTILVNQHYNNLKKLLPNIKVEKLLSSITAKKRKEVCIAIENNDVKIIIGTHSLLSDEIKWSSLALIAIDEQHRFGADQRTKLLSKYSSIDFLMISATPIPKTFAQMMFGFIECLNIKTKPENRKDIETFVIKSTKMLDLIAKLRGILNKGSKIFWVCPAAEENEYPELTSVIERYKFLKKDFGDLIGYAHGGMKQKDIDKVILDFKDNKLKILVATTIIEVGIDIPDADVIIIENSERFGLAQLHQLRGRIGRGGKQGICILIYNEELDLSGNAYKRLKILKASDDGFYISKQDYKIRGGGEIFGLKQSGLFNFKFINEQKDIEIIELAINQAKFVIENNEISNYKSLIKMFFSGNNYYL